MNRRTFIGTSAVAGVAIATVGAKCGGPSVSGTITIITGAISELKPLFPNLGPTFDKIVAAASDFNTAWVAGRFDSARQFFDHLDGFVTQIISDLGVNANTRVKLLLASLGIAVRVVAALIAEQGQQNVVASKAAGVQAPATVNRVNQLANPADAAWILNAVRK